jgi:uncharacterized peroxidase-related enzyme
VPHIDVPDDLPGIRGLFQIRPDVVGPITALTNFLMHAPNSLTPGERELIAARVSAGNDCLFCQRSHAAIAACHLGDGALVDRVVAGPEVSPITPKLKALLAIADGVREGGRSVGDEHIARARQAGATDLEIHDTVLIAAAFCMFNRYVDGLAARTPTDPESYRERARDVAAHGYGLPVDAQTPAR